jgi:hypothetical protein
MMCVGLRRGIKGNLKFLAEQLIDDGSLAETAKMDEEQVWERVDLGTCPLRSLL